MQNDTVVSIESARQSLQQALRDRDRADLSWINPPPETNGWTLTSDAIAFLDQLVRLTKPSHIIEFGAGLSTRAAVRAVAELGTKCAISSIDHDPEFGVSNTRQFAEGATNLTLSSQFANLVARDYGGKLLPTYHLDPKKLASTAPADIVLIDGPPISLGGREGVLYQVLPHCRPGTIVLLDDAARIAERTAVRNWTETLGDAIEAKQLPHFTKGMAAVIVHETVQNGELWPRRVLNAKKQIELIVPAGKPFVLVELGQWDAFAGDRHAWPLVRKNGEDWGSPQRDEDALRELEARRKEGATHFFLPWTSFWWADVYGGFLAHLRKNHKCVVDGDLLLGFDLRA
jgi:predicted O-methyltransferase YrrM